jgi:hypothetical protein
MTDQGDLDYVGKLRREIVRAICEASVPTADLATGDRGDTLYIGSTQVCDALILLLAEFLEGVPGLDTHRDIRIMSETVARKLRLAIAEIRARRAETGAPAPPSIVIRSN